MRNRRAREEERRGGAPAAPVKSNRRAREEGEGWRREGTYILR
jgi:hypothetical protein